MNLTDTLVYLSIGSQVISIGVRKYFFNIVDRLNNKEAVSVEKARSVLFYLICNLLSCFICLSAIIAVQVRFLGSQNADIHVIRISAFIIFLILLISFIILVIKPLFNKIKTTKQCYK